MTNGMETTMNYAGHEVLDLFAGTGVGVAVRSLGAHEHGVEIMPEALLTREANGLDTAYNDVWDAELAEALEFDTLWASPPCQTFSMAGNGAGRKALNQVLKVIADKRYLDIAELRRAGLEMGDERIGLVLTPLHYAIRFLPPFIALEQVPPVLPVWQAMAEVLREWGYSVWVGYLHAEQYGVPQTRKRAVLMAAQISGQQLAPLPTHSRYYSRDPKRLDPGVKKWVSMAEALGWGQDEALLSNQSVAGVGRATRDSDQPGLTMTQTARSMKRVMRSNYGSGGDPAARGERSSDLPAATITSKADRNKWDDGVNITVAEASTLQSYPTSKFIWKGVKTKQFLQIGNAVPPLLARAVLEELWK